MKHALVVVARGSFDLAKVAAAARARLVARLGASDGARAVEH